MLAYREIRWLGQVRSDEMPEYRRQVSTAWARLQHFWEERPARTVSVRVFADRDRLRRETGYGCHHANPATFEVFLTPTASPGHELNHLLVAVSGHADRCDRLEEAAACVLDLRRTRMGADLHAVKRLPDNGFGEPGFPCRCDPFVDIRLLISFAHHILEEAGRRAFRNLVLAAGPRLVDGERQLDCALQELVDGWMPRLRAVAADHLLIETVLAGRDRRPGAERVESVSRLVARYGESAELMLHLGRAQWAADRAERARASLETGLAGRQQAPVALRIEHKLLRALSFLAAQEKDWPVHREYMDRLVETGGMIQRPLADGHPFDPSSSGTPDQRIIADGPGGHHADR